MGDLTEEGEKALAEALEKNEKDLANYNTAAKVAAK